MDKFTFGMYKGQSVESVIKTNPKYVLWAHSNVSFFSLTDGQVKECKKPISSDRRNSYFDRMDRIERNWADDYDEECGFSQSFETDMRSIFE